VFRVVYLGRVMSISMAGVEETLCLSEINRQTADVCG